MVTGMSQPKKVCVITGANSGIGKEAAYQIAEKGYHVILTCRNRVKCEDALNELMTRNPRLSLGAMTLDVSLKKSIKNFIIEFTAKHERLDVLINNAADFDVSRKAREVTEEGIERVWATNYLGPVLLTESLLPIIVRSGGRVINISSKGLYAKPFLKIRYEDPEYLRGGYSVAKAYYQSKLALEMYTWWLSERLRKTSAMATVIRVGNVAIDINRRYPNLPKIYKAFYQVKKLFAITPAEMAKTYAYVATSDEVRGLNGKCFEHPNKVKDPSKLIPKHAMNKTNIERLIQLNLKYLQILQ